MAKLVTRFKDLRETIRKGKLFEDLRLSKVNRYRKLLINSADPRDYLSSLFRYAATILIPLFVAAIEAIEIDLSDVQLISLFRLKSGRLQAFFLSFPDDEGPSVSNERIASTMLAQSAPFYKFVFPRTRIRTKYTGAYI